MPSWWGLQKPNGQAGKIEFYQGYWCSNHFHQPDSNHQLCISKLIGDTHPKVGFITHQEDLDMCSFESKVSAITLGVIFF